MSNAFAKPAGLDLLRRPTPAKPSRKQWNDAQAKYNELYSRRRDEIVAAELRWTSVKYASTAVQKKIDSLSNRLDRVKDRIFKMLEAAPRDWERGVPSHYICSELSYDDAFSSVGTLLSKEPPHSYGY